MKNTSIDKITSKQKGLLFSIGAYFIIAPLALALSGTFTKSTDSNFEVASSTSQNNSDSNYVLGSQINAVNYIEITVLDDIPLTTESGNYLRLKLQIKNNSTQNIVFSPLLQLKAVDANGDKHNLSTDLTPNPLGGELAASETVTGYLDFSVDSTPIVHIEHSPHSDGEMRDVSIVNLP